ncbi:hypothetical protein OGAPHI_005765 [Ogataea philodendri]|uniref:Uncharacterized protein n=1 Tax=Ogataea philodendri TaxID=1378263 RepID=A0A9P8NYE5_9ASCO|nr:uncharacterized protein OGAPHI_005765 [Ogataea philodendri]KAH3662513.1 hypothetical protein OGAPHI_005765 [Ogataea philodendri]
MPMLRARASSEANRSKWCRMSPAGISFTDLIWPVRYPRPSGEYATTGIPSSRHVSITPLVKMSRVHSENSTSTHEMGCTLAARRIVSAPTSLSEIPRIVPSSTNGIMLLTTSSTACFVSIRAGSKMSNFLPGKYDAMLRIDLATFSGELSGGLGMSIQPFTEITILDLESGLSNGLCSGWPTLAPRGDVSGRTTEAAVGPIDATSGVVTGKGATWSSPDVWRLLTPCCGNSAASASDGEPTVRVLSSCAACVFWKLATDGIDDNGGCSVAFVTDCFNTLVSKRIVNSLVALVKFDRAPRTSFNAGISCKAPLVAARKLMMDLRKKLVSSYNFFC